MSKILVIDGNLFARKMFYKFGRLSSKIQFLDFDKLFPKMSNRFLRVEESEEEMLNNDNGETVNIKPNKRIDYKIEKMIKRKTLMESMIVVNTGILYGIMRSLIAAYKTHNIAYTVICYDPLIRNRKSYFKYKIDNNYKAGREADRKVGRKRDEDAKFYEQLLIAQTILKMFGIEQTWTKKFEADDLLQYYSKKVFKKKECLILTNDHDSFQLIDINDSIYMVGKTDKIYNIEGFVADHHIAPSQYRDVLSLSGCPGDEVKGLKGITKNTALSLIAQFGDLKRLLTLFEKHKDSINPKHYKILAAEKANGFATIKQTRKMISLYGLKRFFEKEVIISKTSKKMPKEGAAKILKILKFKSLSGDEEIETLMKIIKGQTRREKYVVGNGRSASKSRKNRKA